MTIFADPPVAFVYADWIASYPEFANVSPTMAANYFDMADAYFENSAQNPAINQGLARMTRLSYMVTAHIAWLLAPRDANGAPSSTGTQPAPGIVGRINSASEGSVSVGVELKDSGSPSEAFFTQSTYGFMFWQATAQYRTMRPVITSPTGIPTRIYPSVFRGGGRGGRIY